jgi:RNA polymerase sigma-70 factor, ECF subfamily
MQVPSQAVANRPDDISDETLAERAARGDRDAQTQLIHRFERPIFSLCLNLVGPTHAHDLAQDALVRILTKLDSFSGMSRFGTWVYRVTTNECLSHMRRQKRSPVHFGLDSEPNTQVGEPNPDSGIQMDESLSRVRVALMNLPEDQRTILVLRDVRGLDYEQLGEVLEIPIGTVRSRLFRARKALMTLLEQHSPETD